MTAMDRLGLSGRARLMALMLSRCPGWQSMAESRSAQPLRLTMNGAGAMSIHTGAYGDEASSMVTTTVSCCSPPVCGTVTSSVESLTTQR